MTAAESLESVIARVVERMLAGRYSERHALVTSYDPQNYMAKVKFMPYGQQSGWLPIETGHIGQGYGIAIGLQPGTGDPMGQGGSLGGGGPGVDQQNAGSQQTQAASDALGDQVIVRFQETDFESGKIVQRVHSEKDKPPGPVHPGEMVFWTKFKKDENSGPDAHPEGGGGKGCQLWFRKDGSIEITDGNGASMKFDGKGNITVNGKKLDATYKDDVKIKTDKNYQVTSDKDTSFNNDTFNVNDKTIAQVNGPSRHWVGPLGE